MAIVYLHIGQRKTGTTALQGFLEANRGLFGELGWCCPVPAFGGGAVHELAYSLGSPTTENYSRYVRGESADSLFRRINEQIATCNQPRVVMSSESFSTLAAANQSYCRAIRTHLSGHDFRIVVYLRRQDLALEARYKQRAKTWHKGALESFADYCYAEDMDYSAALAPWADEFGTENIIVRVYEKRQMPEGLIRNFCAAIELPFDERFSMPTQIVNPSMSLAALRIIQRTSRLPVGAKVRKQLNILVRKIFPPTTAAGRNEGLLSWQQRADLMKRYEGSNARVARIYLGREDGRLFYDMPSSVS